jgi:hypothetical protein
MVSDSIFQKYIEEKQIIFISKITIHLIKIQKSLSKFQLNIKTFH